MAKIVFWGRNVEPTTLSTFSAFMFFNPLQNSSGQRVQLLPGAPFLSPTLISKRAKIGLAKSNPACQTLGLETC